MDARDRASFLCNTFDWIEGSCWPAFVAHMKSLGFTMADVNAARARAYGAAGTTCRPEPDPTLEVQP